MHACVRVCVCACCVSFCLFAGWVLRSWLQCLCVVHTHAHTPSTPSLTPGYDISTGYINFRLNMCVCVRARRWGQLDTVSFFPSVVCGTLTGQTSIDTFLRGRGSFPLGRMHLLTEGCMVWGSCWLFLGEESSLPSAVVCVDTQSVCACVCC